MNNCSTHEVHNKLIAYGGVNIFDEHIGKHHETPLNSCTEPCLEPVPGKVRETMFQT